MPIVSGVYVAPTWNNGTSPYITAAELQAMSDTIAMTPVGNGGTGASTASQARTNLGITPANIGAKATGTEGVSSGGTGRTTLTANAVLVGNETSAIQMIASDNGALYATSANEAPSFGTLPVAQGGTGLTDSPSLLVNLASTSAANVMAASPRPGVTGALPIANGGTGSSTAAAARSSLGITLANIGVIYSSTTPAVTNGYLWLKPV